MPQLCHRAAQLLREEMLYHEQHDHLPPFNEELMKRIIEEIQQLHGTLDRHLSNPFLADEQVSGYVASNLVTLRTAILRNKHCALAYLKLREKRVADEWWRANLGAAPEVMASMNKPEKAFFSKYDAATTEFMSNLGLDLRLDLSPPLGSCFVQVQAKTKHGQIATEDDFDWSIDAQSRIMLPRSTALPLVQKGVCDAV
eukprot:TRINITY_DN7920_c0_g1_i2.p1 TRINITY_DN7920_c0_g1~~TRINITY_DN7920_c0_g1_i2.p1  ORF type:complete len:199 (+),score=39.93 TRINITY_DN7920_c0_g1_i2:45-641(+)